MKVCGLAVGGTWHREAANPGLRSCGARWRRWSSRLTFLPTGASPPTGRCPASHRTPLPIELSRLRLQRARALRGAAPGLAQARPGAAGGPDLAAALLVVVALAAAFRERRGLRRVVYGRFRRGVAALVLVVWIVVGVSLLIALLVGGRGTRHRVEVVERIQGRADRPHEGSSSKHAPMLRRPSSRRSNGSPAHNHRDRHWAAAANAGDMAEGVLDVGEDLLESVRRDRGGDRRGPPGRRCREPEAGCGARCPGVTGSRS